MRGKTALYFQRRCAVSDCWIVPVSTEQIQHMLCGQAFFGQNKWVVLKIGQGNLAGIRQSMVRRNQRARGTVKKSFAGETSIHTQIVGNGDVDLPSDEGVQQTLKTVNMVGYDNVRQCPPQAMQGGSQKKRCKIDETAQP